MMRAVLLALALLSGTGVAAARRAHGWILPAAYETDAEWTAYKKHFKVKYASPAEESYRRTVFEDALARAAEWNQENVAAGGKPVFGVTKFSDRTQAEFDANNKGRRGMGHGVPKNAKVATPRSDVGTVETVDWTAAGYVTPVKNQGQCGSCWAHSAVEQIESQWMLAGNAPWALSVQQVTSCTAGTFGCGGGDTVGAYDQLISDATKFGMDTFGVSSEAMTPYVQSMYESCVGPICTEGCRYGAVGNLTEMGPYEALTGYYVAISDFSYATTPCEGSCSSQNLTLLNENVASTAPASICVNAAKWGAYVSGVLTTEACGGYAYSDLDHCVQLTGYDLTADEPYYLVRNSWATNWGEDGYILLSATGNTCGLADEATFVSVVDQ
eukprot:CAMPEP_0118963412 /NCGR_PEP_ID=MMETSP1173-20130426/1319_1 /TAXON_ID=1034831 /ORGANISM="Rhizochromulina marina cf, Strain CCMP1243" /LENGTH=383 /DNA_ID=CAMNT_0006911735 /DNA_START=20 /DNA_END=1171 /DNA_ORIENTATION=+